MLTKSISTRYQYIYWREVRRYILWILDEKSSEAQWKCFECVYFITSPSTQDFQVFKIPDHLWLTENDRAAWFYLLKDATTVTLRIVCKCIYKSDDRRKRQKQYWYFQVCTFLGQILNQLKTGVKLFWILWHWKSL